VERILQINIGWVERRIDSATHPDTPNNPGFYTNFFIFSLNILQNPHILALSGNE
jgi:hypothetical protein